MSEENKKVVPNSTKKTSDGRPIYYYRDLHKPAVEGEEKDENDSGIAEFW